MTFHHEGISDSKHGRAYLIVTHIAFGLLLALSLALVFGYFVMLLWNAVLPGLISVHPITYWRSVGLLLLVRILVGGISHGRHGHGHRGRREAWRAYDEWWKEVGKRSFEEFAEGHGEAK